MQPCGRPKLTVAAKLAADLPLGQSLPVVAASSAFEVRVAEKSSFAINGSVSTRTLYKSLISLNVGLLPGPPLMIFSTDFIYLSRLSVAPHTTVRQ